MKRILLACAAGMSTSIIVDKMQKYAKSIGEEAEILAVPAQMAMDQWEQGWDIILLGPQVRFLENNFKNVVEKAGSKIKVMVIPFQDYGMANGEAIFKMAEKAINE